MWSRHHRLTKPVRRRRPHSPTCRCSPPREMRHPPTGRRPVTCGRSRRGPATHPIHLRRVPSRLWLRAHRHRVEPARLADRVCPHAAAQRRHVARALAAPPRCGWSRRTARRSCPRHLPGLRRRQTQTAVARVVVAMVAPGAAAQGVIEWGPACSRCWTLRTAQCTVPSLSPSRCTPGPVLAAWAPGSRCASRWVTCCPRLPLRTNRRPLPTATQRRPGKRPSLQARLAVAWVPREVPLQPIRRPSLRVRVMPAPAVLRHQWSPRRPPRRR